MGAQGFRLTTALLILILTINLARAHPPHIFFLLADDLGYANVGFTHASPPSPEVQTPNLDALASSGAVLTRHYVHKFCSPTRSSIQTGRAPIHVNVLNSDVMLVGHHGSYNGTTMALARTVSPCMAVISMGDSKREEDWTAWAYGHPRKAAVQTVASSLGCSRPPRDVEVGLGQRRFEGFTVNTALYGTGWEGTVVLEQSERGTWKASTER